MDFPDDFRLPEKKSYFNIHCGSIARTADCPEFFLKVGCVSVVRRGRRMKNINQCSICVTGECPWLDFGFIWRDILLEGGETFPKNLRLSLLFFTNVLLSIFFSLQRIQPISFVDVIMVWLWDKYFWAHTYTNIYTIFNSFIKINAGLMAAIERDSVTSRC